MRNTNILSLLFLVFVLGNCSSVDDGCSTVDCLESVLKFELAAKDTGENVLENGLFNAADIKVFDADRNPVDTYYETYDHTILIPTTFMETGVYSLIMEVNGDLLFLLNMDLERNTGECCTYSEYKSLMITNAEYEMVNEVYFKILVTQAAGS